MYRGHRPRGQHGPSVGGDQLQVGWCAPHKGPRRLGFGEGVLPPNLGGKFPLSPPWPPPLDGIGDAAPLGVETLEGAHPLPFPYIYLRVLGLQTEEF